MWAGGHSGLVSLLEAVHLPAGTWVTLAEWAGLGDYIPSQVWNKAWESLGAC